MNYNNKTLLIGSIIALNCVYCLGCSRLLRTSNHHTNNITTAPAQHQLISNKTTNNLKEPDQDLEEQLMNSARSIEKSLATLAASQEINNIPILNTAPLLTPEGGMGHTADIDWTGPLEPLLQKIADLTNYNLKILGSPSPIPIIVSITQSKAIVADILKNASLQAGNRVNIVVFPANRIIELRYKFGSYSQNVSTRKYEHN